MAKLTELSSDNFEESVKQSGTPVLVDFWAPWCGPCKAIAPILEEVATEIGDKFKVCKLNVDDNNEVASQFNIRAIPTILLFKNGEVVDQIVGMTNKADLLAKMEAHA